MNSFWRIFSLELKAFVRSKALALLVIAAVGWMLLAPFVFRGDGTAEGARTLVIHYSLGGVAALLAVALTATATGSLAKEREARRLQLTMVRPVRYFTIALGKICALSLMGLLILALAAAVELMRADGSRRCRHLYRPVLMSPRAEAELLYPHYMADPETPEAAKRAPKETILRLLVQRACDRYQTVDTNETAVWHFRLPAALAERPREVRLRFTNNYDLRDDVRGELRFEAWRGLASNITQTVTEIPLAQVAGEAAGAAGELAFANRGKNPLMLRPRRDVELLVHADGFRPNLVRAVLELAALIMLLVAFGVFLGAGLGRPVALFVALVVLLLGEMTPSVVEQYPDQLEEDAVDRVGLVITRAAARITHPFSSLRPLAALAADECVEPRELLRVLAANVVFFPLVFSLLTALVLPRKHE